MKKVFITGVAGFLGSNLANKLLNSGAIVHGVDNFISSKAHSKHLQTLMMNPSFLVRQGDICNVNDLSVFFESHSYDCVFNFACPASPPIYQKYPIETMLTCTLGVHNVVEYAKFANQNVTIVHASTSEVYGDPQFSPQKEEYWGNVNPYGPRSCYDSGKRASEALAYDYLNKGVDVRLVRIFNTFGPNMDLDDGRVVTNLIKQALNNEDMIVYGDGTQTRSFCYVDDLINAIIKMSNLNCNPGTPINIGNNSEISINDLASFIKNDTNSLSSIVHVNSAIDDPQRRRPDLTLANEILNWEPSISYESGLRKMICWMQEQFV